MPDLGLIDNDVIFKIACFDCTSEFAAAVESDCSPHRLVVADFVIPKKIQKSSRVNDKEGALKRAKELLAWAAALEPTNAELELAADIETAAQQLNIPFDSGESQLLAILIRRHAKLLYTGDKRAIKGLQSLRDQIDSVEATVGKIVCFEQIILVLLERLGSKALCERVCREAEVDKAIAICCGCASGGADDKSIAEGLSSYIRDMRKDSGNVLHS